MNPTRLRQTSLSTKGSARGIRFCGLLILLLCLQGTLYAQFPVSLHPLLGPDIDVQEAERIGLSLAIPLLAGLEFERIQMMGYPGQREVILYVFPPGSDTPETFHLTESQVNQLRRHIHSHLKGLRDWFVLKETLTRQTSIPLKVELMHRLVLTGQLIRMDNYFVWVRTAEGEHQVSWVEIRQFVISRQKAPLYEETLFTGSLRISPARVPRAPAQYTHSAQYFFMPSAFPLQAGNGYYRNFMLVSSSGTVGVNHHVSVTAGAEKVTLIASLLLKTPGIIGYTAMKASTKVADQIHLGGGVMAGGLLHSDLKVGAGLAYGMVTVGDVRRHATFSCGALALDGGIARWPMMTLSGFCQLGKSGGLVTENWFITSDRPGSTDTFSAHTFGLRVIDHRVAIDAGLWAMTSFIKPHDNSRGVLQWFGGPFPIFGLTITM